jgi:hypothetical protein
VISHVVGEAEHAGKFMPGFLIEVGVAEAGVHRAVANANV